MIKGFIFDFDNTLYNYDLINNKCLDILFNEIVTDTNKSLNYIINIYNEINKTIKKSNSYSNKFNKIIYFKNIVEKLNLPFSYVNKYYNIYNTEFNNNIVLNEYVEDILILLKNKGIKIGILSNNILYQQNEKLIKLDILKYIDIIQTSDEFGQEKPFINIFYEISKKMNISFDELAYCGDNFEDDIIPSLNLNMLTFYYNKNVEINLKNKYIEFGHFNNLNIFLNNYFKYIDENIFLSKYYGQSELNVQGPGGNISVKQNINLDKNIIFIKSSGSVLGDINYNNGYCIVNNNDCIKLLNEMNDSSLKDIKIFGKKNPSMETFFHCFMKKYTVHIHFTLSNIFLCSNNISFDDFIINYKIIEYNTPGIKLASEIYKVYDKTIDIYILKNHGLIITSNDINELNNYYKYIFNYFNNKLNNIYDKEYNTFILNNIIYNNLKKSLIVKYLNYDNNLLNNIIYCFPDLAIFIEKIVIKNNIEDFNKDTENTNILILNNNVYIISENIQKYYFIIELLYQYKIIYEINNGNLTTIDNKNYLQNMEQEKYRKL